MFLLPVELADPEMGQPFHQAVSAIAQNATA